MIVNLCPHVIAVVDDDGITRIIERGGQPVRIETRSQERIGTVDGVAIHAPSAWGGIINLPPRAAGTVLVVSQIAALAVAALHPDRTDVVYPGTARDDDALRSAHRVVAVSRLIRAV